MKKFLLPTLLSSSLVLAHERTEEEIEQATLFETAWHLIRDFFLDYGVFVFGALLVVAVIAFVWWLLTHEKS
ncbi:MAG: hypothetical protein OXR66_05740 [Candidatus Woesearchaeota archaeon]|nr:hypothetical protein [Candidatus Woesearchaeota archaeon]